MPTNHSYGMGCSSCSGCMTFGTIRPITLSPLSRISLSGDLPLVSLGPVRVLDARLSTRGIPRRSRSRARPLLALWVQGSRGTASERITTISLDSTRSQLFCNGTGTLGHSGHGTAPTQDTEPEDVGQRPLLRRADQQTVSCGVDVGEHLSFHGIGKADREELWSPTGLGKSDRPG